jgi:hypothetical protein
VKLLLENWREYQEYHDVFDNREYITEFLGIQLPLNESGHVIYTADLREQIIKEHLLLEGFLDSVKKYVADKTAPLRDFMLLIYRSITEKNSGLMNLLKLNLYKSIIAPLRTQLNHALKKFKLKKIKKAIHDIIQEAIDMGQQKGPRGMLNFAGLALFLRMAFQKFQNIVREVQEQFSASGQIMSAMAGAAKEWFTATFGDPWELIKKATASVVDIEKWLGVVGTVVGSAATVAKILHPAIKGLANKGATNTPEEEEGEGSCHVKRICSTTKPTRVGAKAGPFAGEVSPEDCEKHRKACSDFVTKRATSFDE